MGLGEIERRGVLECELALFFDPVFSWVLIGS